MEGSSLPTWGDVEAATGFRPGVDGITVLPPSRRKAPQVKLSFMLRPGAGGSLRESMGAFSRLMSTYRTHTLEVRRGVSGTVRVIGSQAPEIFPLDDAAQVSVVLELLGAGLQGEEVFAVVDSSGWVGAATVTTDLPILTFRARLRAAAGGTIVIRDASERGPQVAISGCTAGRWYLLDTARLAAREHASASWDFNGGTPFSHKVSAATGGLQLRPDVTGRIRVDLVNVDRAAGATIALRPRVVI